MRLFFFFEVRSFGKEFSHMNAIYATSWSLCLILFQSFDKVYSQEHQNKCQYFSSSPWTCLVSTRCYKYALHRSWRQWSYLEPLAKNIRWGSGLTLRFLEPRILGSGSWLWGQLYSNSEANYIPAEKDILAAYKGVQAASEGIGTEAQLLLVPRLPWQLDVQGKAFCCSPCNPCYLD